MASELQQTWFGKELNGNTTYLQKFRLYETSSNFYMIGRNKSRTVWRVLKIDRLEPYELNVFEDSTTYSEIECCDLLTRINDGNKSTGGLKFVTTFYGIVGFVKFLGPYYILLITKRRKIGVICGHAVYAITKSQMIPIPNSAVQSNMAFSKNENRSFVNSVCKCKMSMVLQRKQKGFRIQSLCIPIIRVFHCVCSDFDFNLIHFGLLVLPICMFCVILVLWVCLLQTNPSSYYVPYV